MDIPTLDESDFRAVESMTTTEIRERYEPWCDQFHEFVNQLDSMRHLQKDRLLWMKRTRSEDAFGNFAVSPNHWYTFSNGGRIEAQFNVGMWTTHVRVGMGFEFTKRVHGNPELVWSRYRNFQAAIKKQESHFREFVRFGPLAVEYCPPGEQEPHIKSGSDTVDWLLNPPADLDWIFVGRLLLRGEDTDEMSSSFAFGRIVRDVFDGLKPYWRAAQVGETRPI